MVWFRVDDTFAHHGKVIAAGNAAVGLWTRAGAWSMQQLTDGFVPDRVVKTLGTVAEANRLVSVGLWLQAEGGYSFHQWEGRQPSREKVEADRHAATERQRKARDAAKSRRDSRSDKAVSHGPPDPTRPDPTHKEEEADKPPTPKTATQLPADFAPTERHELLAHELSVDLAAEWPKFCDHHRARGSSFKDWSAALNNWIRKAAEYGNTNVRRLPSGEGPNDWMRRRL